MACSPTAVTRFRAIALLCLLVSMLYPHRAPCAGMTLTVESAKDVYLVDEPLLLTVTVKNTGKTPVEMPVLLNPMVPYFVLYISEPGGKPARYDCGIHADMAMPERGTIFAPGEAVDRRMWLATRALGGRSMLTTPGTYTFFARYNLPKEFPGGAVALRSADIRVQVRQPEGAEKAAHDLLLAGAAGAPWDYPDEKAERPARMERYARLVQAYPKSVYALYAQEQYAEDLRGMSFRESGVAEQERARYLDRAVEQFRIFTDMAKDTPLASQAYAQYGRALAGQGQVEQAAQAFEAALLAPGATYAERMRALSWSRYMESGGLREHVEEERGKYPLPERTFPLTECARVFGFTVVWDAQAGTATISNPHVKALLPVGSNTIIINGKEQKGALSLMTGDGQLRVSARTLGYLLQLDWLTRPAAP